VVSIIVPVYNVEKVFHRCLESIINQTFADFECILVDDCSPDNCGIICDEYAEKDCRFKVIHKTQNEGLPKARKSGLDVTQGEFVVHVDSDDWLELNALELLHNEFVKTNADIIWGSFNVVMKNMVIRRELTDIAQEETLFEYLFLHNKRSIWGGGYRKSLFDGYIVPDIYTGEDAVTNVQLFSKTNKSKMRVINSVLYNYDLHNGGASLPKSQKYESFSDYPYGIYSLWIESYLRLINADNNAMDAFNYFICNRCIFYYMRFNLALSSREIKALYNKYYQPCSHKKKLRLPDRLCLILLAKCFPIGKTAVIFFNVLAGFVKKIKGM
jgi:glycosyltransferase involved in cell wall biosynthesis